MRPGALEQAGLGFPRARRLKRRRLIRPLFQRHAPDVGRLRAGVVRLLYRTVPRAATGLDTPLQVGFAPGRTATKVARNRIRRVMRETFRHHQDGLLRQLDGRDDALTVFVLFQGREATAPGDIRRDLPRALDRLVRQLDGASETPDRP